jgi:hypothetical protein
MMNKFDTLINDTFANLVQEQGQQQQQQQQAAVNNPQLAAIKQSELIAAKKARGETLTADELTLQREVEKHKKQADTDTKKKLQDVQALKKVEQDLGT